MRQLIWDGGSIKHAETIIKEKHGGITKLSNQTAAERSTIIEGHVG